MFLIFLDKIKSLTENDVVNIQVIDRLGEVDITQIQTKDVYNAYQEFSNQFVAQHRASINEIKTFAQTVIPNSKFIFNNYSNPTSKKQNDVFSFFGSHEQFEIRPEEYFKNIYEISVQFPLDKAILLQGGYEELDASFTT